MLMMAGMPAPLLKPMIKPFLVGMAGDVAPLLGKVRGAQPSHTGAAPLTFRSVGRRLSTSTRCSTLKRSAARSTG